MPDSSSCRQDDCAAAPDPVRFGSVAASSGLAALRVLTINHRTLGLTNLQRLSIASDWAATLHERLSSEHVASVVLATCNRAELYWWARVPGDDEIAMRAFAEEVGVPDATLDEVAARRSGDTAAAHAFRVSCGLESLALGEAEILGQVRSALEACTAAGPLLEGVFRAAIRTGRLARAETGIGTGALSVASAAIRRLSGLLPLAERRVLVVGAGHTGRKAARHLRAVGVGGLVIANRTRARADAVAGPLDAEGVGLEALAIELARADAVLCAASAGGAGWVLSMAQLRRALADRPSRPLVVVDLAMPAGVEPGALGGVTRIDLAGIEQVTEASRRQRQAEVPRVEALIERELGRLRAWALRRLIALESSRCA
jgi:glutamyl-tRNA reductase